MKRNRGFVLIAVIVWVVISFSAGVLVGITAKKAARHDKATVEQEDGSGSCTEFEDGEEARV